MCAYVAVYAVVVAAVQVKPPESKTQTGGMMEVAWRWRSVVVLSVLLLPTVVVAQGEFYVPVYLVRRRLLCRRS